MQIKIVLFFILISRSAALEYNKQQRYNPNTDFLLHEAGGRISTPAPKRDYVASQPGRIPTSDSTKQDYNSQFPALVNPSSTTLQTTSNPINPDHGNSRITTPTSKRDYVAPQPGRSPTGGSAKQDYISQFPALGTSSTPRTTSKPYVPGHGNSPKSQSSGKRDYVAPQTPSYKSGETGGKVKDLINFYDSKNNDANQKTPSYSSILQGSGASNSPSSVSNTVGSTRITQATPIMSTTSTMKPISFSTVVGGTNKPGSHSTVVTSKPSTRPSSPMKHTPGVSRPGTPVLPSEILNNNRNQNQGNSTGPSDVELQILSEELLRKDINNAAKYITINYQEKTTSQSTEDKAPLPLLTIAADAWNIPTVQKFVPLLDNYDRDTLVNEYVTPQERNEENTFMDAIMSTSVIRHLMNFLKEKGYVTPDPRQQRDFLKQLWFSLYSRGKGKLSSSGFEHVFVSEVRDGGVLGLHNWIYFAKEESSNRINYLGYLKYLELGNKGTVLKLHFNQQGADKPVNSMFIGTSPEFEIALYTLCFVTRADNDCKLKLGNKNVDIVTHTFRYRSKNLIGSAYPQI